MIQDIVKKIEKLLSYKDKFENKQFTQSDIYNFQMDCIEFQVIESYNDLFGWHDKGKEIYFDNDLLDDITLDECLCLLVSHAGKEEICEGHLPAIIQSGHISLILNKLKILYSPIESFPKILSNENIDNVINKYSKLVKEIPIEYPGHNIFNYLDYLKRGTVFRGPYPCVTLSESANRIMTDLTLLCGIKNLLTKHNIGSLFYEYSIEYGNQNTVDHDIMAENDNNILIGEGFNVSTSLFQEKKRKSLNKLRESLNKYQNKNVFLFLVYNDTAVDENYSPRTNNCEYHLKVNVDEFVEGLL